ncbi:molybdenum cofactor biosynthesis protein MoeA [Clostridium botulinum]|uniref:GTP 3',8-cyclase n=1 Tax=Clostridium botulinum C/D str. DC5 TaxID=1443128 RepID=A0A0A0IF51_CLOBO|nr:GTP 3',8-cyclase MoaA [Clostridium botulinum]KGM92980.1 molybdenum cofactor biosynthesis protein MoeA [Clostridium botulinum D str. CCUG 7971]KGM98916.1 molybdenum cofactor biosynthesis protein MoeA [Clostridium botulinum C/D str. DC5]KOC50131.1 molybdenum cofactor biosynthesis protein MoeA [Clostridium botulinum]KOC50933.1 molybdenum cofactor biosynthesis protein MoeA [Clostridium botulinum]KOC57236.1 molybdenum cofactor biosynthesis protein MoeA [Clostridium botulinum]
MLDSYGRKIEYLRISLTEKCNLKCIYCMPKELNLEKKYCSKKISNEEIIKFLKASVNLGIKKVRYTGGEPLIVKDIDKLIYNTGKIPEISDISITTNGILLYDMVEELKNSGLKRVNISLDTLKEDRFKKITRKGDINKVFKGIDRCLSLGMTSLKINVVLLKGINDDEIGDFVNLTKKLPIDVRFIELMPIGVGIKFYKNSLMTSEEVLERFPMLIKTQDREISTAELYKLRDAKGRVGFISPLSCKFCKECNKIRLTSEGIIKPCLHSKEELSIKEYIDNEVILISKIKEAILNKPEEHNMELRKRSETERMMFQIGG